MNEDAVGTILSAALRANQEKRAFPRLPVQAAVQLLVDGELVEGDLVNISLTGAFVVPRKPIPLHAELQLTIINPGYSRSLSNLRARVVRVDGNGVGVTFDI
jgi:hypothetical protein